MVAALDPKGFLVTGRLIGIIDNDAQAKRLGAKSDGRGGRAAICAWRTSFAEPRNGGRPHSIR